MDGCVNELAGHAPVRSSPVRRTPEHLVADLETRLRPLELELTEDEAG